MRGVTHFSKGLLPRFVESGFFSAVESDWKAKHPEDARPIPQHTKYTSQSRISLCKEFVLGHCTRERCKYEHNEAEKQARSKILCCDHKNARPCSFGLGCAYDHKGCFDDDFKGKGGLGIDILGRPVSPGRGSDRAQERRGIQRHRSRSRSRERARGGGGSRGGERAQAHERWSRNEDIYGGGNSSGGSYDRSSGGNRRNSSGGNVGHYGPQPVAPPTQDLKYEKSHWDGRGGGRSVGDASRASQGGDQNDRNAGRHSWGGSRQEGVNRSGGSRGVPTRPRGRSRSRSRERGRGPVSGAGESGGRSGERRERSTGGKGIGSVHSGKRQRDSLGGDSTSNTEMLQSVSTSATTDASDISAVKRQRMGVESDHQQEEEGEGGRGGKPSETEKEKDTLYAEKQASHEDPSDDVISGRSQLRSDACESTRRSVSPPEEGEERGAGEEVCDDPKESRDRSVREEGGVQNSSTGKMRNAKQQIHSHIMSDRSEGGKGGKNHSQSGRRGKRSGRGGPMQKSKDKEEREGGGDSTVQVDRWVMGNDTASPSRIRAIVGSTSWNGQEKSPRYHKKRKNSRVVLR